MAGPIPYLSAQVNLNLSWEASKDDPLLGIRSDINRVTLLQAWQNLEDQALPQANQCMVTELTVPAGDTLTVDLSAAISNVLEDDTATILRVFGAVIWLPTAAQLSAVVTTEASSVTVGKAGSHPANLFGLLNSASSFTLYSGDLRAFETPNIDGYPIHTAQKNLLLTNNDDDNVATVLLALVGSDRVNPALDFSNPNNSMFWPLIF